MGDISGVSSLEISLEEPTVVNIRSNVDDTIDANVAPNTWDELPNFMGRFNKKRTTSEGLFNDDAERKRQKKQ